MKKQSRRSFIKAAVRGGVGLAVLPNLIPSRLLGADAPGRKINVAQIGCGRMGRSDLGNVLTEPLARVVAVCDLDSMRLAAGKQMAEDFYAERGESGANIKIFHGYRDVLASPDIDAVVV
ncbi:MAG: Gfo/Idh/MocA family oxidoreductase, partial [Limisphaerales bacterium]